MRDLDSVVVFGPCLGGLRGVRTFWPSWKCHQLLVPVNHGKVVGDSFRDRGEPRPSRDERERNISFLSLDIFSA